ncbi:MAG TPA: hypothetical protein VFQ67_11785 [Allosphingosinicella sp.]|nr:hypothetical protein [Allosphingosinicella sp.]
MLSPGSSFEETAAPGRRAQLILALLLLSVFPVFFLTIPIQTHSVRLDLPRLPGAIVPASPPRPDAYLMTTLAVRRLVGDPERTPRFHELVVTPHETILFDGREVDVRGLAARLGSVEAREEWVDFRPDPNARYELFAEILAMTRRARIERLRLDSRPFRGALDEPPPAARRRSRRHP